MWSSIGKAIPPTYQFVPGHTTLVVAYFLHIELLPFRLFDDFSLEHAEFESCNNLSLSHRSLRLKMPECYFVHWTISLYFHFRHLPFRNFLIRINRYWFIFSATCTVFLHVCWAEFVLNNLKLQCVPDFRTKGMLNYIWKYKFCLISDPLGLRFEVCLLAFMLQISLKPSCFYAVAELST